jgi:hypothetical protein
MVRLGVLLWAGLRLLAVSDKSFTKDPSLQLWLFAALTQAQILFVLLISSAAAIRRSMLDLVSHYGAAGESIPGSGGQHRRSYARQNLSTKRNTLRSTRRNHTDGDIPFTGEQNNWRSVLVSRRDGHSLHLGANGGETESREGIVRQDDFEIRYEAASGEARASAE